jgi:nicotinamidase-related amidase
MIPKHLSSDSALKMLKDPALVVVDMQNDFVRVGAPLEVPEARATIPTIARLLARFRQAQQPVIFTRYVADSRYLHLKPKLSWIGLLEPPVNSCVPGFTRFYEDVQAELDVAEVIDELRPLPGEVVLDKVYYSAFHGTNLDEIIRQRRIGSLVITGTVAEMCVEDTARHAVHFGLPTVLVSDAVSSNNPQAKQATLEAFERNYGWVLRADEVRVPRL